MANTLTRPGLSRGPRSRDRLHHLSVSRQPPAHSPAWVEAGVRVAYAALIEPWGAEMASEGDER